MTQYLIRTIEHKGETFTDVITVRDNERYQVVDTESKEQAEKLAKKPKGLLDVVPSPFNNDPISRALSKSQRGPSVRDVEHYGE